MHLTEITKKKQQQHFNFYLHLKVNKSETTKSEIKTSSKHSHPYRNLNATHTINSRYPLAIQQTFPFNFQSEISYVIYTLKLP